MRKKQSTKSGSLPGEISGETVAGLTGQVKCIKSPGDSVFLGAFKKLAAPIIAVGMTRPQGKKPSAFRTAAAGILGRIQVH